MGVDLGSSNTRVFVKDKGIVIDEPTLLARIKRKKFSRKRNGILAAGIRAKEMWCREPKQIEVVAPIRNGVVVDLEAAEKLVQYFLKLVYDIPSRFPKIFKPLAVVGVSSGATEVQKRAVKEVFKTAGVGKVLTVEEIVLAAVGLGLPMLDGGGLMVVSVGGGKTEVGVISMGGVVVGRSIRTAGDDFDQAIVNYTRMKYGILIGLSTAARVKIELGNKKKEEVALIRGRDLESGLPKTVKLTAAEVGEAVNMELVKIVKLVAEVLDETPPELMDDIIKRGIIMTGGGSQVMGLAEMLSVETKINTVVAEDPGWCVIKGVGEIVSRWERTDWVKLILEMGEK